MEKRKRFEYPIAALILLAIFGLPIALADHYAWSNVYFSVPTTISFTVSMPGAASNLSSTAVEPGGQTDDIYFNASTGNDKHVAAGRNRAAAANTSIQVETSNIPILQFKNTGTVNITMGIRWNNTPAAEYLVYANSSIPIAGGAASAITDNTAITSTTQVLATAVQPSGLVNIYLYANFTGAVGGTSTAYQLLYNSTPST